MRSHAKASTAGSTMRQATGLGRVFRGADAGRALSPDSKGSSAPAGSHLRLAALVVSAFCSLVVMTASIASGAVVTEYVRSFGPDGTEASDFERVNGIATDQQTGSVYVLDGLAGVLYKFDGEGQPVPWGGSAPNITDNQLTGISAYDFRNASQVAVDSTSHVVYVTEEHSVRAFQEDGEAAEFTAGPGAGTNAIPGFGELHGVATDANGNIYASDYTGTVSVYAPSGEPLTSFAGPQPGNLAVAPGGSVYFANDAAGSDGGVHKFVPSELPVTAATTYAAGPMLESTQAVGHFDIGVGVDPVSGDVYVLGTTFNFGLIKQYDSSGEFVRSIGASGEEGELDGGWGIGIAIVGGGEELQFYVGSTEAGSENFSKVEIFGEVVNPGPPSVESTSVTGVGADSATLHARVNPNTFATTYHFEYGFEDCSLGACVSVPLGGAGIGSGHRPVVVSRLLTGLQAGATYHYRILAENSKGLVEGPDRTFTTQVSGLGFQLTDRRAWEVVSPVNKFGGQIRILSSAVIQAAADGNGLAYTSVVGSLEAEPQGNRAPEESVNFARRVGSSWQSKDITPPHTEATPVQPHSEYRIFTPDLAHALVEPHDSTPLSPQASERTIYLRDNSEPVAYSPLVTGKEGFANVPPGTVFAEDLTGTVIAPPLETMGSNSALTDVVFVSRQAGLSPGAPPGSLYEWSGGQLRLINKLPIGEGGGVIEAQLGSERASVRNAVSEDGSRIFWSKGQGYALFSLTGLYARDTETEESVRLDTVQPGASGAGEARPTFHGASADGSVVFFTDPQQLVEDASPIGRDLYRCVVSFDEATPGCSSLSDISAPLAGSGESAEAQEMTPAITDDGTHVYFVARGVLDAAPNGIGESATGGDPNLYIWRPGQGARFIATLSEEDGSDWGEQSAGAGYVSQITAAASPSGRYFSFMSERSLTGYDNRDALSGEPAQEIFRYDAVADRMECVSCNPSGALPVGQLRPSTATTAVFGTSTDPQDIWEGKRVAAIFPEALHGEPFGGSSFYRPRAVLDNGRVFFNAFDSLVSADSNGQWDVYEYEPTGVGDCTAASTGASIARLAGGCVSLISSGTAEKEAAFLDTSVSGDDVFFLTPARLSVTDEDSEADVYDARVDGVPAILSPSTECLGDACQPAAIAPNDPTPASAGFRGEGNVKPALRKRCAKGKRQVRQGGRSRCVERKQHRRKGHATRGGKGGRASR